MKTALLILALFAPLSTQAQTWTVAWYKNPEPFVTGYKVYEFKDAAWSLVAATSQTNYGPVRAGCFAVTAYCPDGESDRSTNVWCISRPTGVNLTPVTKP
jgi:hypothetical protein